MPGPADGLAFVRTARQRWPGIPLAAVTAYPADLDALVGTPEWPILVVTKPVRLVQLLEVVHLLPRPGGAARPGDPPRAATVGGTPGPGYRRTRRPPAPARPAAPRFTRALPQ